MTPAEQTRDRRATVRKTFGIPLKDYDLVVEYLMRVQHRKCALCGDDDRELLLDHCHATGRLRAMVCRLCNTGLGMFRDKPELLRAAAAYLERA